MFESSSEEPNLRENAENLGGKLPEFTENVSPSFMMASSLHSFWTIQMFLAFSSETSVDIRRVQKTECFL
jgi:hypothetical protein